MTKFLKLTLDIEQKSNINMYLYYLKKIRIFKKLKLSNSVKLILELLTIIMKIISLLLSKIIYILILLTISKYIKQENHINTFIHIFICFSFIGGIINSKITQTSKKKYYSIMLLNMNAKHYLFYDLILYLTESFIGNIVTLTLTFYYYKIPLIRGLLLSILVVLIKITGEYITFSYYNKFKKTILNSTKLYFAILISLTSLALILPLNNITISLNTIYYLIVILTVTALISIIKLNSYRDYKLMYKRILVKDESLKDISITKEELVSIRREDYEVNPNKLKNKKGVTYLNTLFFERHKSLLIRSAITNSVVIFIIFLFLLFVPTMNPTIKKEISKFILGYFPWLTLILYFINKGPIIVQALFTNCDRYLLKFNFYRNKKLVNDLFKQRLNKTIIINLLPAITMSISIGILLMVYSNISVIYILLLILSIISLNILFSTYHIVMYYLIQPYSTSLKVKSLSYEIMNILMYFIIYTFTKIKTTIPVFTISIILITIILTIIGISLTIKYSEVTFRDKGL